MSVKKQKNTTTLSFAEKEMFLKAFYQQDLDIAKKELNNSYENSDTELFINTVMQQGIILKKEDYQDYQEKISKKSKNKFESFIDLHGCCRVEAKRKLIDFIEKSKLKGHRNLLVIHGKGFGIVKSVVYDVIKHHQGIKSYKKPALKLGGSGAVIIYLKE